MLCHGRCFVAFECKCSCFSDCKCDEECACEHLSSCNNAISKHKECVVYCKFSNTCCSLINCSNYFICTNKIPEYVYARNGGICDGCYFAFGNLTKISSEEECCVCLEKNNEVMLTCGHSMCAECMEKWFQENEDRPCPFCRQIN